MPQNDGITRKELDEVVGRLRDELVRRLDQLSEYVVGEDGLHVIRDRMKRLEELSKNVSSDVDDLRISRAKLIGICMAGSALCGIVLSALDRVFNLLNK